MKYFLSTSILLLFLSGVSAAQGVIPGCYCVDGQLQTVEAGEFLSSIVAGTRYSAQPCQTAFGQPDGTNCTACSCTDDFNDAGFFQIQNKNLFTGTPSTGFAFTTCDGIIESDETLLFCGPCPGGQTGNLCEDFIAPDIDPPVDMMEDAATIPTMGQWSLIILSIGLLIISVVTLRSKSRDSLRMNT